MPFSAAMRTSGALLVGALAALSGYACAYPRRTTSVIPVAQPPSGSSLDAPPDLYTLTIASAQLHPQNRGAIPWDDNGGLPDVFVKVYRNDELVWESPTIDDDIHPQWNVSLPRNFRLTADDRLRFEVWDRDPVGGDPVGIYRHVGPPANALPGAEARLILEGDSFLSVHFDPPRPHHGVGIRSYEVRDGEFLVLEVEPSSPAGRAEIAVGDHILAIGGHTVSELGAQRAAGALSMSSERREALRIRTQRGQDRTVELDAGFIWLSM